MANSLYDLVVNVSTDIASLNTGFNAAADRISAFSQNASKQLGDLNGRIEAVTDAFKTLAGLSIAGFGLHEFADLIEGAIEAQSNLQDLAVKVGSTAASLSSLIPAAKLSGTSMDEVALASSRFSKSLIDVQTGTGKATEAFKALGFSAADAQRFLQDPSQGLLELAQRLNTFSDDGTKTAAVMALLGKSGQQLLPFLKELGDQQELVTRITNEQAAAAHALEDQWRTLSLRTDDLKNSIATGLVPVFSDILKGFTDTTTGAGSFGETIKSLAADGSLASWALSMAKGVAILGESLVFVAANALALKTDLDLLLADAQLAVAASNAPKVKITGSLGFSLEEATAANAAYDAALKERNRIAEVNSKAWQQIQDGDFTRFSTYIDKLQQKQAAYLSTYAASIKAQQDLAVNADSFDRRLYGEAAQTSGAKQSTGFNGADLGVSQFQTALDALRKQAAEASAELDALFSGQKITAAEKYLAAIKSNADVWKTYSAAEKAALETEAARAAAVQRQLQAIQDQQAGLKALTAAQEKYDATVAASTITLANAAATSQLLAISQAQADIKRQYDRGLIDFKNYYDQQTAYQKQAIAVQVAAEQTSIDALQAEFVKALNNLADVQVFDTTKFKTIQDFQAAQINAQTQLLQTSTKLAAAEQHLNDTQQKGADIGKGYVEELTAANAAILTSNKSLQDQINQQELANQTIGLTASQIQLVIAAKDQELLQDAIAHGANQQTIDDLTKQIELRQQLAATLAKGEDTQRALDAIKSFDQEAQAVFEDVFQNGHDAFQKLGDDIKKYLIDLIYQLTVRPIIVQLAAQLTGINPTNVAGSLLQATGANPLSLLFGGNSLQIPGFAGGVTNIPVGGGGNPLSFLSSGISTGITNGLTSFALSSAGTSLGLSTASTAATLGLGGELAGGLGAGAAGEAVGSLAGGTALTEAGTALAGAAAGLATAIPYIGIAIAAASALGLFDKKPSPAEGQFQISSGTTGFEDNAFTPSPFGNLGFNDANTQQFSGQGAQVFNQVVAGALQAFATRFSPEQSQQFALVLKNMTFQAFSGTFTTEDFLQKYGGRVLQQVVTAAFQVLDPALASVITNFKGTADEVAKFANSLLAIHDVTSKIGNDTFTQNVDAALADATQATADKVVAFVTIIQQFGDSITGLGAKLEGLDAGSITKFIDALGGAQQALSQLQFINDNFTTSAQRAAQTQQQLTSDFAALGLAVPQTHAAFLALLNSIDVTTDAGRTLYASIAALAPEFVAVAGTADQAAQALAQAAQTGLQYFTQHFLSAQEQLTQRQAQDSATLAQATGAGTVLNQVLHDLGYSIIPTTVDGVRALITAVTAKYGADSQELQALYAIIPTIGDLIDSVNGFGTAAQTAATQVTQATNVIVTSVGSIIQQSDDLATTLLGQFSDLASQSSGDFGAKLAIQIGLIQGAIKNADPSQFTSTTAFNTYVGKLKASNADLTTQLGEFNRLSALYDASRAEQLVGLEIWRNQEDQIFKGMPDDLAVVDTLFQQKWDAIVNGVSGGVNGTLDQLQTLRDGIADWLKGLQVGNLSPLSPQDQLAAARANYLNELALAQPTDTDAAARNKALGDVTQFANTYLTLASDLMGSASQQYRDVVTGIENDLAPLAGTLPTGLPLPNPPASSSSASINAATTAIAAAVPSGGDKIASKRDIADLKDAIGQFLGAAAAKIVTSTDGIATTQRRQTQTLAAQRPKTLA